MKGEELDDLALVLRAISFSESSAILTCLTREHGLVQGLAKGARRERSPLRFLCDAGFRLRLTWRPRRSSLSLITGGALVESYAGLRGDLARLYGQGVVIDLLRGMAPAGLPQPELFDGAHAALLALAAGRPVVPYCLAFVAAALDLSGFGPRADRCVRCGWVPLRTQREGDGEVRYRPQEGGVVCARCDERPDGLRLRPAARALLADLLAGRLPKPDRVRLRPESWAEAGAALLGSARTVLERDLPALAWLLAGDEVRCASGP